PTSPQYTPPLSQNAVIIRLIEGGLIKIRKEGAEGYHQSLIDIQPEMVMDKLAELLI
ncbi:TPA: ADP-heptose--LPS heptosyltransferase, partial [Mannheimia haemolytica]|nr:ADP-heptose--LPS heptosyltransferase [Mannheimia haemolytica]